MKVLQSLFGASGGDDRFTQALRQAEIATRMGPWRHLTLHSIGGLTALGFDRQSEVMLVTSHSGQSVIQGTTGEITYRNREDDGLDRSLLKGTRLDHPADERFDMAGMFGGGLLRQTADGWRVDQMQGCGILRAPHGIDDASSFHLLELAGKDIRVLGFSWTGRTLVCATPNSLRIWGRPAPLPL